MRPPTQPQLHVLPPREWQQHGSCRHVDAEIFFPPFDVEPTGERHAREARAKAICAECPVQGECLAWALEVAEPYGVWGGYTESERRELLVGSRQAS